MSKFNLYNSGLKRMNKFLKLNPHVQTPKLTALFPWDRYFSLNSCGFFRPDVGINIMVSKCASLGYGGPAWSWPSYVIDRTPFGVIAHELGHHVDYFKFGFKSFRWTGEYSISIRKKSGEEKITSYCPNDAEWFAEMFRLFVTNPDLLRLLRPKTYELLCNDFSPIMDLTWEKTLTSHSATPRIINQARKKIDAETTRT